MKKYLLAALSLLAAGVLSAQITVTINGQITDPATSETILLSNGEILVPLSISEDGRFTVEVNYDQLPGFVLFQKAESNGKLTRLIPRIWFEKENLNLTLNLENKTFEVADKLPFQQLSEDIEALSGKEQVEKITNNPNQLPSLYFADKWKEDISIQSLESFIENTSEEYLNSVYIQRIQHFIEAKGRTPIKKGNPVTDFHLKDDNGVDYYVVSESEKKKLVAFFSSGCSYSIASINLLAQLNAINDDKIEIITIWTDDSEHTWLNAYKEEKEEINWINLWDQFGFADTYFDNDVSPQFFVINSEGILVDQFKGYSNKTAKKLKALVK